MAKVDLAKLKAFYDKIREDFIPKEVQEAPITKRRKTVAFYGKAGIGIEPVESIPGKEFIRMEAQ